MTTAVSWLLLGLCAAVAAGGYVQVALGSVFWCGRVEAFPGTTVLALLCLAQAALFLAASASPCWSRWYRMSQLAVLPFLLLGLVQVFAPRPRTVLCFGVLLAIPTISVFKVFVSSTARQLKTYGLI